MTESEKENLIRLSCYVVIGGIAYGMNNVLLFIFRGEKSFNDNVAVALAFFITSTFNFVMHNAITFRKSKQNIKRKLIGHITVTIINYFAGVTTAILTLRFIMDNNFLATACSTAVTFSLGYGLFNRFVYKTNS